MAYNDFMLPYTEQLGYLHCYCQQIYNSEGPKSIETKFKDGEAALGKWQMYKGELNLAQVKELDG